MLYLLRKNSKNKKKIYIGDRVNIFYRFNGIFFIIAGYCVLRRHKSLCIYAKKKQHHLFFSVLYKNIYRIDKLDTFCFNNLKWKTLYRSLAKRI